MSLNYYNNYCRSFLISKYIFKSFSSVTKLSCIYLSLGFNNNPRDMSLAFVFLFLLTGFMPSHIINFHVVSNNNNLNVFGLKVLINYKYIFVFLTKLVNLYLPSYENWFGVNYHFNLRNSYNNNYFMDINDFCIFSELDFLLNFNYGYLSQLVNMWSFSIYFDSNPINKLNLVTLLSFFQVPVFIYN